MDEKQDLNKKLTKQLQSGDKKIILNTLKEIRSKGNAKLIPEICNLLLQNDENEISNAVLNFFHDLKNQKSVDNFVKFLEENRKKHFFKSLLSACWQNGLNYSKHIKFFIHIVLEEEYSTAIEAFSIIEENIHFLTSEERIKLSQEISQDFVNLKGDKKILIKELLSVIDIATGPFSFDKDSYIQ